MNKIKDQLKQVEENINNLPLIINPCELCVNHNSKGYNDVCHQCCYYYASEFKVKGEK